MRPIVVLFGAGASHGAGWIRPERPPLGAALFHELSRLYPGSWGALPWEIRSAFAIHFESGMGILSERAAMAIPQLMREMAVYFIQFRADDDRCLYMRLINDLRSRGILDLLAFSSLNYDCVFDLALAGCGMPLNYFDPPDAFRVPLWKLHGSCNMFSKDVTASQGISYGSGVTFEGGIQAFLDSNRVIEHSLAETGLAPVMCLYMKGKPTSVSPSALKAVQDIWSGQIVKARAVFVVGTRPWPDDRHVWGPLAETSADVFLVGDASEGREWARRNRKGRTDTIGAYFGESYATLLQEIERYAAN